MSELNLKQNFVVEVYKTYRHKEFVPSFIFLHTCLSNIVLETIYVNTRDSEFFSF